MATALLSVPESEDYEEEKFETGSCFSRLFCWPTKTNFSNTENRSLLQGDTNETWWNNCLQRLQKASEPLAGPKFKTFIRKFSFHNSRTRKTQFQYDSQSYALNFDEEDESRHEFSSRFAPPLGKFAGQFES